MDDAKAKWETTLQRYGVAHVGVDPASGPDETIVRWHCLPCGRDNVTRLANGERVAKCQCGHELQL